MLLLFSVVGAVNVVVLVYICKYLYSQHFFSRDTLANVWALVSMFSIFLFPLQNLMYEYIVLHYNSVTYFLRSKKEAF